MQGYRVLEESLVYKAGKSSCELSFVRCTEPHKLFPLYDLELKVDRYNDLDSYTQSINEKQETFQSSGLWKIIQPTIEALDDWCQRHPYTFISFFDCLTNFLKSIYYKVGFVSDGRMDTFIAFVNQEGKRIAFKGMLNLLESDDFWVNDIWRVAKDFDYYTGEIYTPVDMLSDMLSELGIPHLKTSYKKP